MYNRVVLLGNLTRDPDYGVSEKGNAYCRIDIATNRRLGEHDETYYGRCIAFGGLADYAGEYLQKGNRVFIEGRLRTDSYKKDDGSTTSKTVIVVERIINLSLKGASNTSANSGSKSDDGANASTLQSTEGVDPEVEAMLEEF